MILTRRYPWPYSSYSKAQRKRAPEMPRRTHEVLARYERVSLGPVRRTQTQPPGARYPDVLIVGVVFFGGRLLGNRHQVRARLAASSEGTLGIHSSRAACLGHARAGHHA